MKSFWHKFLGFDPSRKQDFPGQQPGEEVELLSVFHGIRLVPFFIYMIILVAVIIGINFFTNITPATSLFINTIAAAVIIHIFCMRMYNYFLKVIIVTNRRLIYIQHSTLLTRERETIPLTNIQDFRFRQNGILPRLLGYGDLIILGSSSEVKYKFNYVPKVNKVHHIIGEVHQKMMRGRTNHTAAEPNQKFYYEYKKPQEQKIKPAA